MIHMNSITEFMTTVMIMYNMNKLMLLIWRNDWVIPKQTQPVQFSPIV